jgi:hypothetical protein
MHKLKWISLILLLCLTSGAARAQAAHSVGLTWTASTDAAANPSLAYNVYRLNGACPAVAPTSVSGSGFTKINTASVTTTAYTDSTVAPGTYCYFATAFISATESVPSNDASAIVQPKSPTSLGVTTVTELFNDGESVATWRRKLPSIMIEVRVPA